MSQNVLIFDTETTTTGGQILSFYANEMVGQSGGDVTFATSVEGPSLPMYIVPDADRPIHPAAYLVHKLSTDSILKEEQVYTSFEAATLLQEWFSALHRKAPIALAAWNARFDYGVFNELFERALLPSFFVSWGEKPPQQADVMQMFSVMQMRHPKDYPVISKTSKKTGRDYVSRTLGDACTSAGVNLEGVTAHDVVDDVEQMASPIFEQMWGKDYRLMRHMWSMGDRTLTQQLLRQVPDAPLYYIDTSGQVAVGRFILSIPLTSDGRKKDAPWQLKRNVAAISIDAANVAKLRGMTVNQLADLLSPPNDAQGNRPMTRAFQAGDVTAVRQQPIVVLNVREYLMLFDRGAQDLLDVKPDKARAKAALELVQDKEFQKTIHAAWMEVVRRDDIRNQAKTIKDEPFVSAEEREVMDGLRFEFHQTLSWEGRAQVAARMSGKDRVNALRILHQHAPHVLTQTDVREWQAHLHAALMTEDKVEWVTVPQISRAIAEIMADKATTEDEKRYLRQYSKTELPRIMAQVNVKAPPPPRKAPHKRAKHE